MIFYQISFLNIGKVYRKDRKGSGVSTRASYFLFEMTSRYFTKKSNQLINQTLGLTIYHIKLLYSYFE